MPGDVVRRLMEGHDSQRGYVTYTHVRCYLRVLNRPTIICDIDTQDLLPLMVGTQVDINSTVYWNALLQLLSYRVLHDTTPQYLGPLTRVAGRRAFRSAITDRLEVPYRYFKLSIIGGRAFPVAASQIWNSLPETVVSASTLRSSQRQLKLFYFNDPLFISTVIVVSQ